ncbi:MAG: metallophosphoesterase [Acidiferrobacterales bacterium]
MKIVHVSDIHNRNLKMHDEYQRVFDHLYEKLDVIKPDILVNTGDIGHTKTQISPEFVDLTSNMIRRISDLTEEHIILGNHDLNLMNLTRRDSISPIVESINRPNIFLHKRSGRFEIRPGVNLWVFSLADRENYPSVADWRKFPDHVNIGLFHGSVTGCITDQNWRMTNVEHDLGLFDGLDYVLLGDIHKQQSFKQGRIWYAGSLIQQNFGEEPNKGFLLWDIQDKDHWEVTPFTLEGSRKFFTFKLDDNLALPDQPFPKDSRIRVSPPRELTVAEQKEISKDIRKKWSPYDVIILSAANIGQQNSALAKSSVEDLRSLPVQERLIREFFKPQGLTEETLSRIVDLNKKYHMQIEKDDDNVRNVSWKIDKISWGNLFNYGEENSVDFSSLGGVTGLFAPNGSGKSNFIDILTETCFDAITKGISKNVHIINDNKDEARMSAEITANGQKYVIDRNIDRIKHETKKAEKIEWGKTTVEFSALDDAGDAQSLVGDLRPETEKNIRQRLGTYEDFMLTSLAAQWNQSDLIACRETERKKILYRFLDLDWFEKKGNMAKSESKELFAKLSALEEAGIETYTQEVKAKIKRNEADLRSLKEALAILSAEQEAVDQIILELTGQKVKIGDLKDPAKVEEALEVERRQLGSDHANLKRFKADLERNINSLRTTSEELEKLPPEQDDVEKRYEHTKNELDRVHQLLDNLERDENVHRKNLVILQQVPCGDQFPTCKFLINAFESKKQLETIQLDRKTFENLLESLRALLRDLEEAHSQSAQRKDLLGHRKICEGHVSRYRLQIENSELSAQNHEAHIKLLEDELQKVVQAAEDIQKNERIDAKIAEAKRGKLSRATAIKETQKEISELDRTIGGDMGILEKIGTELAELVYMREMASAYEHYIIAMGKDGIAYQILLQKLPLLNEEINKILANSTEFSVFIEHDDAEQSIRFYLQYGQYKRRLLELGGGAEKFLSSLAIRTALLSISSLPRTNMLIIDEGFGKLDPVGMENISKMFDYLRSVFDHVIIVSHTETMKDLVDNIIDIVPDAEGYAHISVGE